MKIKVGIIGTGNIGTDLLVKCIKSDFIDPVAFVGRRESSDGIKKAKEYGVNVSYDGIDYFRGMSDKYCQVVFDCTNAVSAIENYKILKPSGIKIVDMTPARIGEMCVPVINDPEILLFRDNVNMVTCGGQASIPLLHQIAKLCPTNLEYVEIVSQISSKSAGIATRWNIDQYIHTTESAIKHFTGARNCKVILNLNPADPCVDMQTTMFIKADDLKFESLMEKLNERIKEVRSYVPGYELTMMPVLNEDGIIILSVKVKGAGDYLPSYAGNLDIINCAAIKVVKNFYEKRHSNQ